MEKIFELIKKDHRKVENIFAEIEGTDSSKKLQKLFEELYLELSIHAETEELTFYPSMREYAATEEFLDEAEKEHVEAKVMLEELKSMGVDSPEFLAKISQLKNAVQHHVQEEETEIFPQVRRSMSDEEIEQLAEEFNRTKTQLAKDKSSVAH